MANRIHIPPQLGKREACRPVAVSLGETRKFAFQSRIHLTPAEALGFEGAQWIIVLELLIFFVYMKKPVDVAEAEPIEERRIAWWATNIFRRAGTRAGDADRVDLGTHPLELGLNPDLVFPQIAEIIFIVNALAHAQLEIGECHLATRRVAVALAGPSRTIVPAVQVEAWRW